MHPDTLNLVPTGISDRCTPLANLNITWHDTIYPGSCYGNDTIYRYWIIEDLCGNATTQLQRITRIDTIAPTFTQPNDTIINCDVSPLADSLSSFPSDIL
ncbi:MAG: hypothetical protein HC896_12355 [Bacteroidales bacterium]|nr:hypothetical protein [Bacteroidales bacterium]